MRPRIVILTNYPYDETRLVGGVESVTEGILEGLVRFHDEFEFHLLTATRELDADRAETRRGFTFHFIASRQFRVLRPRTFFIAAACARKLRDLKPDLVHCHDNKALALGAICAGRPDIFTVHGVKRDEARKWRGSEYWSHQMDALLESYVNRRFRMFIAVSKYSAGTLGKRARVAVIPNPLAGFWFHEGGPVDTTVRRIVCIGSYNRLKRQHLLLDAVRRLRLGNTEVILAGSIDDQAYFEELKSFVSLEKLDSVQLKGAQSRSEIRGLLGEGALLVHPSAQENSPMVIAEAMARGVPVVAARVGGVPEMIEHERHGLLVEPDNAVQIAEAIQRIVSDAGLRSACVARAMECAREMFSAARVAEQTVQVYRAMIGGRAKGQ